jgi:acetylornithine/N-succinyldiaminopimelate aminotransferase
VTTRQIARLYDRFCIPVYSRLGLAAVRAKGSWVWDAEDRRYLDLFPGWGTNALGHCHPAVVRAVREQVGRLIHVPNTFYHPPHALLAEGLVRSSFPGKVFFSNSGAESVEAAIKLVRRFGRPSKWEILTAVGSFHGRTMGAMAATGQVKHQKGFEPLLPGFRHLPFNDLASVERAIRPETAAVMIELIQGEGGIHVATKEYVQGLRKLCDERELLLIFDEISTGMGRTGTLFCYQQYGVIPDILLLAKPAAGGLPMGVLLAGLHISDLWEKASHATTFGGNPLVTAAGWATLQVLRKEKLAGRARRLGKKLRRSLEQMRRRHPMIREIRGLGLMLGIELDQPGAPVIQEALKRKLLLNCTQERVLRLYPALNIKESELQEGWERLEEAISAVEKRP